MAVAGFGVALGTSKRPRRCDAVVETEADEIGAEVAEGVAVIGANVGAGRTVREGSGGALAAATAGVDVGVAAEVSPL